MNCPKCNAPIKEEYEFCGECGTQVGQLIRAVKISAGGIEEAVETEIEVERNSGLQQSRQKVEHTTHASTVQPKSREEDQFVSQDTGDRKDADIKKAIPKERWNGVHPKKTRLSLKKRSLFSSKKLWIGVLLVTLLAVGVIVHMTRSYSDLSRWWYRTAAYIGYTPAMHNLGEMYEHGRWGVDMDYAEAMRWYRKAADRGNGDAMENLAWMYYFGRGIDKNYTEAFRWFRKAAEKGHAIAMLWLGIMYLEGRGVDKNFAEAELWFRRAVNKGNPAAAMDLGYMYEKGLGVAKDDAEAIRWYRKAVDMGYSAGNGAINSLTSKKK